jgi:hypothetical protein
MALQASGDQQDNEGDMHAMYAGAKQQIAALEQQLENLQDMGAKHKSSDLWFFHHLTWNWSCNRELASNVTQEQVIGCLVSMFQSIKELVDENDHRRVLEVDGSSGTKAEVK